MQEMRSYTYNIEGKYFNWTKLYKTYQLNKKNIIKFKTKVPFTIACLKGLKTRNMVNNTFSQFDNF